jgi:asparagine synthase (glutamine-hydrolysing)
MCGIVGVVDWGGRQHPDGARLGEMLGVIRHRGPDEVGIYLDTRAGLGSVRLSIVDLSTGRQPITNEDGSLQIVYNGEVFNYLELRADLEKRGHRFTTRSDTEVILHLYEELGPACLDHLNGQFAIAIWDVNRETLFLARDRIGICPLFYAELPHGLVFGSEIKALFASRKVPAQFDAHGLAQAFTFWAPIAPRTAFEGVRELPPAHYLVADPEGIRVTRYWDLAFPPAGEETRISEVDAVGRLRELLSDATRLRLRADVTVGSYLSGGLDSTYIAALVREHTPEALETFSISFEDAAFDETPYQEVASAFLGTRHHVIECRTADVGIAFPDVVRHAEAPILRTAPAPMFLLSKLVRDHGIKVVLTGEGADEFFGGYNIFKEDKVRRFWAREPASTLRPLLLRRLYPYITDLSREGDAYLAAFFGVGLTETGQAGYSHRNRWRNTARLHRFLSPHMQAALEGYRCVDELLATLDSGFGKRSALAQAQALEITTFMSPYLLSSQGDRMLAAHSVEGRFPFLDHRVIEFANALPPHDKLRGLEEKHILRKSAEGLLPATIVRRRKQPYRAPIHRAFFGQALPYVDELMSPEAVQAAGIWHPQAVEKLRHKCTSANRLSESEEMALVAILSTQLLHHHFVDHFAPPTRATLPAGISFERGDHL